MVQQTTTKEAPLLESLSGEQAYEAAIDTIIQHAERELRIFDSELSRGGYTSLKRYDALREFLFRSRNSRLTIVLHQVDFFSTHCPRLMGLLKTHSHAISVCQTAEHARAAHDPFMIADQQHYMHRFHVDDVRLLLALNDPLGVNGLRERFDQLLQASSPAVFATTLGL